MAKVLLESAIKPKPVMKLAAAGLTPMSPTMDVVPVVEIPVLAKATKLAAVPKLTAAGPFMATGGAATTCRLADPDLPDAVAVIIAVPTDLPVATPVLSTVATAVASEDQAAVAVRLTVVLSEYVPVATKP